MNEEEIAEELLKKYISEAYFLRFGTKAVLVIGVLLLLAESADRIFQIEDIDAFCVLGLYFAGTGAFGLINLLHYLQESKVLGILKEHHNLLDNLTFSEYKTVLSQAWNKELRRFLLTSRRSNQGK